MKAHPDSMGPRNHGDDVRQQLSAAMDGDAEALGKTLAAWRSEPSARADWHAFHLIGDVLRTQELASAPERDEAFLHRLRARLAHEPVVLAPSAPIGRARNMTWRVPTALVAGLAAVVGVAVVVSRLSAPTADAPADVLAGRSATPPAVSGIATASMPGQLVRDARLDEFLRAHQAAHGGMSVPGSGLTRASVVLPAGDRQ